MQRLLFSLLFASTALLFGSKAHAAEAEPTAVNVRCSCNDELGKAYFNAVKTLIGKQTEYKMVAFAKSAEPGVVDINVISMPMHGSDGKTHTVLSIVVTHEGTMTHEMLEACEQGSAEECARSTVAGLHEML